MRPTLPRASRQKFRGFGRLLAALLLAACSHQADPPVTPGPPLPAEPDIQVGTPDQECDGLNAALAAYGECPNLEDGDRNWAHAVIEVAEQSFTAGKKAELDEPSKRAIAVACHKAAESIQHATERCRNGKAPKTDWER